MHARRERERKRERESREREFIDGRLDSFSLDLVQPVNVSLRQNKCMGRKHAYRFIYFLYVSI